jgi:serine/threonine protein kinase
MKVLGVINSGGFGVVERVETRGGAIAARKRFAPSPLLGPDIDHDKLKRRFRREVRIQASLPSDYFLPVLDHDLDVPEPWFTMPLAEKNLRTQIDADKKSGTISQQPLADVLNGLERLHRLGFAHRDLKPENILYWDGAWRLSDLGLATETSEASTRLTTTGATFGTPFYCAPEQLANFRGAGPLADLYAFGCILHDVASDRRRIPYGKQTCEGPLQRIVEKCTEPLPAKRFKDVSHLRAALLAVLAQPVAPSHSDEASAWAAALGTIDGWSAARLTALAEYVERTLDPDDTWLVFTALEEERIASLLPIDEAAWCATMLAYCEWARNKSFDFAYCDVVVGRLRRIFDVGPIQVKAAAALAAAELGSNHNRWYVMETVLAMCDPTLRDDVAERIGIEIKVENAESCFRACATQLKRTEAAFHPRVQAALWPDAV